MAALRYWLGKDYAATRVVKFVATVKTAMVHLLTSVLNQGGLSQPITGLKGR